MTFLVFLMFNFSSAEILTIQKSCIITFFNEDKILKKELFEDDFIVVTLEGYPHARPCFNKDITDEELNIKLEEWKIN